MKRRERGEEDRSEGNKETGERACLLLVWSKVWGEYQTDDTRISIFWASNIAAYSSCILIPID
eukprot:382795-Hanusia_phi.AAC.2